MAIRRPALTTRPKWKTVYDLASLPNAHPHTKCRNKPNRITANIPLNAAGFHRVLFGGAQLWHPALAVSAGLFHRLGSPHAGPHRNLDLQQIPSDDNLAVEVPRSGIHPHLRGYFRIVGRHEMRKHQHLDASLTSHPARIFCARVV